VTHRVNTCMYGVQDGADPAIDGRFAQARREQLAARDDSVLTRSDHSDHGIGRAWALSTCHCDVDRAQAGRFAP